MTDLIQQVKDKQKKDGTSTRRLAKFVGITFSALAKVMRGEHQPSWQTRQKLAEFVTLRVALGSTYDSPRVDTLNQVVTLKTHTTKEKVMAKGGKKGGKGKPMPKGPKCKRPARAAATKKSAVKRRKTKAKRKARKG